MSISRQDVEMPVNAGSRRCANPYSAVFGVAIAVIVHAAGSVAEK